MVVTKKIETGVEGGLFPTNAGGGLIESPVPCGRSVVLSVDISKPPPRQRLPRLQGCPLEAALQTVAEISLGVDRPLGRRLLYRLTANPNHVNI